MTTRADAVRIIRDTHVLHTVITPVGMPVLCLCGWRTQDHPDEFHSDHMAEAVVQALEAQGIAICVSMIDMNGQQFWMPLDDWVPLTDQEAHK